jgi:proteasome accessory factor C
MIRADERLQRLLMAFPLMADEPGLSIKDIAARIGCEPKELTKDFASLERYDVPAGWVDTVQVYIDTTGQASMQSSHFKRPQKLNRPEMLALDLGLGMLQRELPVDERAVVARTRQALKTITVRRAASVSDGAKREDLVQAEGAREPELAVLGVLQTAFEQRCVVVMHYQRPDESQPATRRVRPYALVRADANVYLVGHCERAEALRVFRLDRVTGATVTADAYVVPDDFSVSQVLQSGGVFKRDEGKDDTLVVRYSPQVARWIAERAQQPLATDGTIEVSYPLADEAWAVRHVMQYGPDAVVLSPASIREKVIAAIDTLLGER